MTAYLSGMVLETGGGRYKVMLTDGREVEASLRGRLKQEARTGDRVVIGDQVQVSDLQVEGSEASWAIESVAAREREIVRRGMNLHRAKVIAANVDIMLVVVAARDPDARLDVVDRLLVIAESNGIEPRIVVNKLDLEGARELSEPITSLYPKLGYPTLTASAKTGEGMEELGGWLHEGISALIGPSGVGKSSLLNTLDPRLQLRTGELTKKLARGRHTTVNSRLLPVEGGGWVADTPGFGDVGVWGVDPESLTQAFPEFIDPADHCRFRGCSHTHEPGCGVREAVERGEITQSRMASYLLIHTSAVEGKAPDW